MNNKLNEDIKLAQNVILRETLPTRHAFNDISGIYRMTNENVSSKEYISSIKNKERILSVIASGDQIINSILFGSTDIEGFDISRFPKYFLMLKLAAIKELKKDEYLSFFMGDIHNELFNYDVYSKIYKRLDKEYQEFWDSLFDYFDSVELIESMFFRTTIENKILMIHNNPYLQYDNYEIVKRKIDNIDIKFYEGNIFELINSSMKPFDLVNLSNIINYYKVDNRDYKEYKSFIESIPLNDNGIVLTYLMNYYGYWDQYNILDQFSNNEYEKIGFNDGDKTDGLLLYRKHL